MKKEQVNLDDFTQKREKNGHSSQRSFTPFDQQNLNYSKSVQKDIFRPLLSSRSNYQTSQQNLSQTGKKLRTSMMSRKSSVKSLADRSQKEILSPNYKPFQIFFNLRKNSPFQQQRSFVCTNFNRYSQKQSKQVTNQNSFINAQTPSFKDEYNNDMSSINKNFSSTMKFQQQSSIFENTKNLKNYLNGPVQKNSKIQIDSFNPEKVEYAKLPKTFKMISRNKLDQFYSENQQILMEKTTRENLMSSALENEQCNEAYQQQYQESENNDLLGQLGEEDDDLNYSLDCTKNNRNSGQTAQSQPKKCCHQESERHQLTRFALEKALKLSEILMKEVQRLDTIVQRYQKNEDKSEQFENQIDHYEKQNIQEQKRQLFQEIICLQSNNNSMTDINMEQKQGQVKIQCQKNNEKSSLNQLYHKLNKKTKIQRNLKNDISQKENDSYQTQSSSLIKDVKQCLKQQKQIK